VVCPGEIVFSPCAGNVPSPGSIRTAVLPETDHRREVLVPRSMVRRSASKLAIEGAGVAIGTSSFFFFFPEAET
jgi:hypothetical protein